MKWAEAVARQAVGSLLGGLASLPFEPEDFPEATPKASPKLPVLWPSVPPPGFRAKAEQYRLSPEWRPYPAPPGSRPLMPAGLRTDVAIFKAAQLMELFKPYLPVQRQEGAK